MLRDQQMRAVLADFKARSGPDQIAVLSSVIVSMEEDYKELLVVTQEPRASELRGRIAGLRALRSHLGTVAAQESETETSY